MKYAIIFLIVLTIAGVVLASMRRRKITRKQWEKYDHKNVII